MSDINANEATIIELPIYLTDCNNIFSFYGELTFDPVLLSFNKVSWSVNFDNFIFATKSSPGKINISGAGVNPINGEGVFGIFEFFPSNNFINDSTLIELSRLRWNEDMVQKNVASAKIERNLTNIGQIENENPEKLIKVKF